jgi:hypothetical protein
MTEYEIDILDEGAIPSASTRDISVSIVGTNMV